MPDRIRRPEEILAYRSLHRILEARARTLWSVGPGDTARSALQIMAERDIGFVVVLDAGKIVGVLSERDCARRVVLANKSADLTRVADIMTRNVITVEMSQTFGDCLKLMHQHAIRHLPVIDNGTPVSVISIRDLLSEAVAHHAKVIAGLELERLSVFTSTV